MKKWCLPLLALASFAQAQSPAITRVTSTVDNGASMIPPGAVILIYGRGFGVGCDGTALCDATSGCHGPALELCGVQVLLDGNPIIVQYVTGNRLNALMPAEPPDRPFSQLVVLSGGIRTNTVDLRRVPEGVTISLDGPASVDGPVWIHVDLKPPDRLSYPLMSVPWEFECEEFEFRKDGKALSPLALPNIRVVTFGSFPCPGYAAPGTATVFQNRLPLHLKYRFDEPGTYQVRLSQYGGPRRVVLVQSDWTPIEIRPRLPRVMSAPPQDAKQLMSDFLPNLLALCNDETLSAMLGYLYHFDSRVRQYAVYSLRYWPDQVVRSRLIDILKSRGPTPEGVRYLGVRATELLDSALPYLTSNDKMLAEGAFAVASNALLNPEPVSPQVQSRIQRSLIAATDNLAAADQATVNSVISALGGIGGTQIHDLLWSLADRHIGIAQALSAIAEQRDIADLPRLTAYAIAAPDPAAYVVIATVHKTYGDAALPYLRSILAKTTTPSLALAGTQELILANDPFGFAFARDTIVRGGRLKDQIIPWIATQFPEAHNYSEDQMLQFLSARSAAKPEPK